MDYWGREGVEVLEAVGYFEGLGVELVGGEGGEVGFEERGGLTRPRRSASGFLVRYFIASPLWSHGLTRYLILPS